jgi:glutamate-1-semialdehyde 2,1-aminomutase
MNINDDEVLNRFATSRRLQQRLHELVPGGAHTNARGSDQYPEALTPIIVRGDGARVLDADGNWLIEYGMGLKAITLGHGFRPVVDAVCRAASEGVNFTRPSVIEIEAAERFLRMVPTADMVKFAKNGSDVTTAAVKLARAATGRDLVAVCRTQPFFSVDDWFMATSGMPTGIPQTVRDLTVGFAYNDIDSLRTLIEMYPDRIAAVVMEPATGTVEPRDDFLRKVRELTASSGIVLVFDEMITGMRWSSAGAQAIYGVTPDLSTWGKALGNGFSVSALAGKRELMELGGLNTDSSRVFLLSNTHGAETTGLAAYLAVADAYEERDIVGVMENQGEKLRAALTDAISAAGMTDHIPVMGRPSALVFGTKDHDGQPSQAFRTLFIQEMLRHGVLGQSLVISAAHTDEDIERTAAAAGEAATVYARAVEEKSTDRYLHGRPVAPAIREYAAPRRLEV